MSDRLAGDLAAAAHELSTAANKYALMLNAFDNCADLLYCDHCEKPIGFDLGGGEGYLPREAGVTSDGDHVCAACGVAAIDNGVEVGWHEGMVQT